MKAFLLAAGYGTRLGQLTADRPKPLVEAGGRPLVCYALDLLRRAGVTDIMCNVHYLPEQITGFFRRNENFGFNVCFSFEEEILGTGGGLKKCESFFKDEPFFLINSDIVSDIDLMQLARTADCLSADGCAALYPSVRPVVSVRRMSCQGRAGLPEETSPSLSGKPGSLPCCAAEYGLIADFKNFLSTGIKPEYDYTGAVYLTPSIFKYLVPEFSSVVYTGFTGLIQNSSFAYVLHSGKWTDAGTPENLIKAVL